jgi:hypothetical protein
MDFQIIMSQEPLVQLIEQQIKVEENFVIMIDEQIKQMQNVAARLLLLETQKDSEKHAIILKGILEVINKKDIRPTWEDVKDSYIDKEIVRRNLENHLKTETKMMDYINREIKMTKDEGIKLLLEHMISDEKKHHEILQTIINQAYKIQP